MDVLPTRIRTIVAIEPVRAGSVEVTLDCGHKVRRRFGFATPERIICPQCARDASLAREAARVAEMPVPQAG